MSEGIQALGQDVTGNGKWDMVSKFLGPIDLHYHFRTKPLREFFARVPRGNVCRVLEFGCGAGANLFELKARMPAVTALGVDIDSVSIDAAKKTAAAKGYDDLQFVCAATIEPGENPDLFDYVLLIDVLEHLDDPRSLLEKIAELLKPGGRILISVPTHRYPQVFGRQFHEAVGHVRDGFNLAELDGLLGATYERTESSYNTGLIASAACACFYRAIPKLRLRKLAIVGTIGLHLSRLADVCNGASRSCSLWAVYRRA